MLNAISLFIVFFLISPLYSNSNDLPLHEKLVTDMLKGKEGNVLIANQGVIQFMDFAQKVSLKQDQENLPEDPVGMTNLTYILYKNIGNDLLKGLQKKSEGHWDFYPTNSWNEKNHAMRVINEQVSTKTNGDITEALNIGEIKDVPLTFLNFFYVESSWNYNFVSTPISFYDKKNNVYCLTKGFGGNEKLSYLGGENEDFLAVKLEAQNNYAVYILQQKDHSIKPIDSHFIRFFNENKKKDLLDFSMLSFEAEFKINMMEESSFKRWYSSIGFNMLGDYSYFVDSLKQINSIKMNKDGFKAFSKTIAMVSRSGGSSNKPIPFHINGPFSFVITHDDGHGNISVIYSGAISDFENIKTGNGKDNPLVNEDVNDIISYLAGETQEKKTLINSLNILAEEALSPLLDFVKSMYMKNRVSVATFRDMLHLDPLCPEKSYRLARYHDDNIVDDQTFFEISHFVHEAMSRYGKDLKKLALIYDNLSKYYFVMLNNKSDVKDFKTSEIKERIWKGQDLSVFSFRDFHNGRMKYNDFSEEEAWKIMSIKLSLDDYKKILKKDADSFLDTMEAYDSHPGLHRQYFNRSMLYALRGTINDMEADFTFRDLLNWILDYAEKNPEVVK